MAGSASYKHLNGVRLCCSLNSVCLFSHENKESLFIELVQGVKEDFSLLIKMYSPKLNCALLRKTTKHLRVIEQTE